MQETRTMYKEKYPGLFFTVGYINSLEPEYKPLLAIKAFEKLIADYPQWQLKIIGFGTSYGEIQNYLKEKNLGQKVMLYGPLSYIEIYDVFKRVDVILVPTGFQNEEDMTGAISAIGAPMVIHEDHNILGENKINNAFITHKGSVESMHDKLQLAINSIQSFDAGFIRGQRMPFLDK